jgi:hypothetical protein
MRHPAFPLTQELAVQQVLPIPSKPGVTPEEAATVSRPFALLLSEAEAVHDQVRLSLAAHRILGTPPVTSSGALSAVRDAWNLLSERLPWSGMVGLQAEAAAGDRYRTKRR